MKVSLVVDTVKNTVKVHRHNCSDITASMDSGDAEFASQGDVLDRFLTTEGGPQVTFLKCLKGRLPVSASPVGEAQAASAPVNVEPVIAEDDLPQDAVAAAEEATSAVQDETTERAIERIESGVVITSANQHLYKTRDIEITADRARTAKLRAPVQGKLMWMSDRIVVFKDATGAPKSRSVKNVTVRLI